MSIDIRLADEIDESQPAGTISRITHTLIIADYDHSVIDSPLPVPDGPVKAPPC